MAADINYVSDRIKALEGWSIKVYRAISQGDFEEALKDLKEEKYESRRLEWRSRGLRGLPEEHSSVPKLKKMISSIRAASKQIIPLVEKVQDFKKKSNKLSAEMIKLLRKNALPLALSMMNEATIARNLAEERPWDFNFVKEREALITMLKRKGYYKKLSDGDLIEITQKIDWGNLWYSLAGADLSGAKLNGVSFFRANLTGANLSNAKMIGANLSKARLSRSNFSKADLSKANLTGVEINMLSIPERARKKFTADFSEAILFGANLSNTSFGGINLFKANLSNANLTNAFFLFGANLSNANLSGAIAFRANFSGADLSGTTWEKMQYDSSTLWPRGFVLPLRNIF
jgi:uncharacterized protein YjbI with pentapeptide repeats